jgi:hypothetical protein
MNLERASRFLICSLLLCAGVSGRAQQKAGLLLSTTSASSDMQQPFHTYWITREGASVQVVEGMRLLVPRKSVWWEIGVTELKHVNSEAGSEAVWAAPLGATHPRTHVLPVSDDDTCPDEINTYSVSWAGSDYVALHHAYESTCGAHPVAGEESFMARLDEMQHSEQRSLPQLKLSEVAGTEAFRAMELGLEVANSKPREDETPIENSEKSWVVMRSRGRYRVLGTTPVDRGKGGDIYDIPFDPPKSLVGSNDLSIGWDAILDKMPDALDAYTSPNSDMVVVVTARYLNIFDVKDRQIAARLARVPIESSAVIAAQWAIWTEADRWNETLVPLLRAAPYKTNQQASSL